MTLHHPTLALVLCSRNDNYMGNSLWRLQTVLNYNAAVFDSLGLIDKVEILVTDWGSREPLRNVLSLNASATGIVRFIYVPSETARELQSDSPYPEVLALNAAVRRSRADYVGRIDNDTLVGKRFAKRFFEGIADDSANDWSRSIMFARRRKVPYRFASQSPMPALVAEFVERYARILHVETNCPFFHSPVGIFLMHRDLWNEAGGYDERLLYWGWMEVDLIYRLQSRRKLVDVGKLFHHDFYHLEHYNPKTPRRTTRRKNPEVKPAIPCPNDSSWGLANHDLLVQQASMLVPNRSFNPIESYRLKTRVLIRSIAGAAFETCNVQVTRLIDRWFDRLSRAFLQARREPMVRWPRLIADLWSHLRNKRRIKAAS